MNCSTKCAINIFFSSERINLKSLIEAFKFPAKDLLTHVTQKRVNRGSITLGSLTHLESMLPAKIVLNVFFVHCIRN